MPTPPLERLTSPVVDGDNQAIEILPGEPAIPPPHVRAEIEELLRNDATRIGEIFRLLEAGRDPEEIRVEFGLENSSFVWSYERMI